MPDVLFHGATFLGAIFLIFFFGGLLIEATDVIAKRLHRDGFLVAFVLLGTLTSISEVSVAVNSSLAGVPQVSAGNLVGASFVIFLGIVPLLAFFGKGLVLNHGLSRTHILLALAVVAAPSLVVFDGLVSRWEGFVLIFGYAFLLYYTEKSKLNNPVRAKQKPTGSLSWSLLKVLVSAVLIFFSGRLLVTEAIYFSSELGVPSSFIGLVLIAIGTNIPELVIAIRAIAQKKKSIAFGDYVGSAAFNTLIFGILILVNGPFRVEREQFMLTAFFLLLGLVVFYTFSRSKNDISRQEGVLLGFIYLLFILVQFGALYLASA